MPPVYQPTARHQAHPADGHEVLYFGTAYPAVAIAAFLDQATQQGGSGILVATRRHARLVRHELAPGTRVHVLDAKRTLRQLVRDGELDHEAFATLIGGALAAAKAQGGPVHAFGELVALACRAGRPHIALDLERAWNALLARQHARLLCAYPEEDVPSPAVRAHIDAQHRRSVAG